MEWSTGIKTHPFQFSLQFETFLDPTDTVLVLLDMRGETKGVFI